MTDNTEDFSYDLTDPEADALFLPSIGTIYLYYVSQYVEKMHEANYDKQPWLKNRHPKGLNYDGQQLDFIKEGNGLFHYPYVLYSAGHANLDLEKSKDKIWAKESMLRNRDPNKSIVVADSGGYQIGRGLLNFDWENFYTSDKNNEMRLKILRWQEATADYSMTLDVPAWAIDAPNCPNIKNFEEALQQTVFNNEFYLKNRTPGATRFLNVIQGRTPGEITTWFDAVKDQDFEGWSFASLGVNFKVLFTLLIRMRDEGYLTEDKNWLHMLGVSKIDSGAAYSILQRILRKTVAPNITISYDASSPFLSTAKGKIYARANCSRKVFGYTMQQCFDNKKLVRSDVPFPVLSPLGSKLTIGDLCVKDNTCLNSQGIPFASTYDTFSYIYTMHHNVYIHIKGIVEGNRLLRLPSEAIKEWVPDYLIQFRDICNEVFTCDNPLEVIEANGKLLDNMSKNKLSKNNYDLADASNLFDYD